MKKINLIFLLVLLLKLNKCEFQFNDKEIILHEFLKNQKNFEENNDICSINLKEEMERKVYNITGEECTFKNDNPKLIYIFETNSTNLIIRDENAKGLKYLNFLKPNSHLKISNTKNVTELITITSISNNIDIEALFEDQYDELYLNQNVTNVKFIETKENNLIVNLDSFDENHEAYYSKYSLEINPKDIFPVNKNKFSKIDIKNDIVTLEKNSTYILINDAIESNPSQFEFFINKKEIEEKEIILQNNNEKYLYLNCNKTYKITLNSSYPRQMKLSKKTNKSKITIDNNDNTTLNNDKMFFNLANNKSYNLSIEKEDALIEFLYYFGEEKVFDKIQVHNESIDEALDTKILIKLRYLNDYILKLESDQTNSFGMSIYGKMSKGNFHYYSKECDTNLTFNSSFEKLIKKNNLENIDIKKEEFYSLYLYISKTKEGQHINLTYYPTNFHSSYLNSANYTYIELSRNMTYQFIIEDDDSYNFNLYLDNSNIHSINPIFMFENGSFSNELNLVMKNEGDKNETFLFINYYKNWTNEDNITMTIIADKSKRILLGIYIVSGILIFVCFVFVLIAIKKIKQNQYEEIKDKNELLDRSD